MRRPVQFAMEKLGAAVRTEPVATPPHVPVDAPTALAALVALVVQVASQ